MGILLIGVAVVIVLALIVPAFTSGRRPGADRDHRRVRVSQVDGRAGHDRRPAPTVAEQLGQAAQDELGAAGKVTSVTARPGGPVTVTWEITRAGSQGLTENNARFGVMRIMRAIQQSQLTAGGDAPRVRLIGRYQLPGAAAPVTVVRLRFEPATVERADFDDRDYLEAFELADAAVIHPPSGVARWAPSGRVAGGGSCAGRRAGWPGGSTCGGWSGGAGKVRRWACARPRPPWRR